VGAPRSSSCPPCASTAKSAAFKNIYTPNENIPPKTATLFLSHCTITVRTRIRRQPDVGAGLMKLNANQLSVADKFTPVEQALRIFPVEQI
jgi:hypothetical protein